MQFSKIGSIFLYFCVYINSSLCLYGCSKAKNKCISRALYFLAMSSVVILSSIRYNVGTDYPSYVAIYEGARYMSFLQYIKNYSILSTPILPFLFMKIAGMFDCVNIFFLLFSIVIYIPTSIVILKHRNTCSIFLASFAFLTTSFTIGFNIMKQIAAVSIGLFAMQFIIERRPIKFSISVFIACCFHPTAVVLFPLYFLVRGRNNVRISWIYLFIIVIGSVMLLYMYPLVLKAMGGRFAEYVNYGGVTNNYSLVLSILLLMIFIGFRHRLSCLDSKTRLYITIFFIGVLFESLGFSSPFVKRISLYFSAVSMILVPSIATILISKYGKVVCLCFFAYYIAIFVLDFYVFEHSNIIPFIVR